MFPDGERKPGRIRAPAWRAADDDVGAARRGDDAAAATTRMATAVEMRSEGFMDVSLFDCTLHPPAAEQHRRHRQVTVPQLRRPEPPHARGPCASSVEADR